MVYEPPEYGRYNPGPVFRADGTHRSFHIYDGAYLPGEPILDWRRKFKRPWEGTQKEAEELCRLLNRDREVLGRPVRNEMTVTSKSQRIWRMNRAKKTGSAAVSTHSTNQSVTGHAAKVIVSLFVQCGVCGMMSSGGEHTCT